MISWIHVMRPFNLIHDHMIIYFWIYVARRVFLKVLMTNFVFWIVITAADKDTYLNTADTGSMRFARPV